jgi:hypothetical protein
MAIHPSATSRTNPATTVPDAGGGWSRRRLISVLALLLAAVLVLLVGLGYAAYFAIAPDSGAASAPSGAVATGEASPPGGIPNQPTGSGGDRRDRLAAAPMLPAAPSDAQPAPPATRLAEPMAIPAATGAGPAGVLTGFPRTPQGAVGQLAAIEATVLQAMSIPVAHDVYDAWALPGGVGAEQWSMTGNVQTFLATARMGPEKDMGTVVMVTAAGAQIKGSDGPDWVLACVLLEVDALIEQVARIAYGHCERMQWHEEPASPKDPAASNTPEGRWMIAPGEAPAAAPSTWPGTERAIDAGWKRWDQEQPDLGTAGQD